MNSRDLLNALPFIAAVVDAFRAVTLLQKTVGKVSPRLAPDLGVVVAVPVHKVSDKASEIRGAMKPREARIKQLQKLIEQAQNFQKTKPVHDEYKQIRWKGKQEKFAETHRADLTIWEAANRYLRANLPDMKLTHKAWQTELAKLTAENEAEYAKLKAQREVVSDLQKIHRYVDIALKEDAPQQSKTRNHNIDR